MATTVRITETYDLKTTKDKIGLIGIHTPSDKLIRDMYPGLMKNHRFVRFLKCDVVGACASVLPADPLQVGVTSGTVAPEDMFNPILMRAVTNESFDILMSRIYYGGASHLGRSVVESDTQYNNDFAIYYSLLAENGKYKKAMPQRGFMMKALKPIFHTLVCSYGNMSRLGTTVASVDIGDSQTAEVGIPNVTEVNQLADDLSVYPYNDAIVMKGKSVKMPKIPLHNTVEGSTSQAQQINIPETYVCAIITPPARLHEFYYRLRVSWTIRFEQVIPITEYGGYGSVMATAGNDAYSTNYEFDNSKSDPDSKTDMVDANGVDVDLIMQS